MQNMGLPKDAKSMRRKNQQKPTIYATQQKQNIFNQIVNSILLSFSLFTVYNFKSLFELPANVSNPSWYPNICFAVIAILTIYKFILEPIKKKLILKSNFSEKKHPSD
jgi:hypothetical protein